MAYISFQPSDHFNTVTYTGDGTAIGSGGQSITGVGFQPDWVWTKARSQTHSHTLYDSSRGVQKPLVSNSTASESTETEGLNSFDSDGFTTGNKVNSGQSGTTYASWHWKANGGTTSSNTDGSITSTVQANTTAGFSIVTYTSASGTQTVGHGLGVAPNVYMIKERSTSGDDWFVYHSSLGAGYKLRLSGTGASASDTSIWNNTEPTSSVFSLGNDQGGVNQYTSGTQNYVAYCFAEKRGFSKFGRYTGNGSSDGTFVYTGFKPALVIIRPNAVFNWLMLDNKRDTINPRDSYLYPNTNNAEASDASYYIDYLSNGFKFRGTQVNANQNGTVYYYMAFAKHPFVASTGLPTTAE